MFKFFEKQSFLVILLVMGVLLLLVSLFDIKDILKLQVTPRNPVVWIGLLVGIACTAAAVFFYAQDRLTLGWFKSLPVHRKDDRLLAKCKDVRINVQLGRIQDVAKDAPASMVVLPANEYFDDDCIHDKKSALGAYVDSVFPNQVGNVQGLIQDSLKSTSTTDIEKEPGIIQQSYGIGASVFVKKPLHSKQPVLFLAVATKRAGEGLRAEVSYIFDAVKEIQREAGDNRIDSVIIPIMGTGHGGLSKAVGLFALVLAICDGVSKPLGHHVRDYTVVVFKPDSQEPPDVSLRTSKRVLKTAISLYV